MNYKYLKSELEELNKFTKESFEKLQLGKLQDRLKYHVKNNLWYRNFLEKYALNIKNIKSIGDLQQLPLLEKEHIIDNFPFSSVPEKEICRFYQTSGTTGKPKLIAYNKHDIDRSAQLKARGLIFGGVKEGDKGIAIMAYGPWASGLMSQQAGEYIGLTIAGDAKLDTNWHIWAIFSQYHPKYIISQPSFLVRLEEIAKEQGIDISTSPMERLFVCGDMSNNLFKKEFEKRYNAKIIDLYCCTEFGCISAECIAGNLHYWADELIVEIINPKTKKLTVPGEIGEVVVTGLYKEATPLIRYNTHDLSFLVEECECDCKLPAISPILGRGDDMLSIAGANLYPRQIEDMLSKISGLSGRYQLIITKEKFKDKITMKVELEKEIEKNMEKYLKKSIFENISSIAPELNYVINQSKTAHQPNVELLKFGALSSQGKIKRVIDKRR